MVLLQKYRRGKAALTAIRTYLKQKTSYMQEFELQKNFLLQARVIRAWRAYIQEKNKTNMQVSKLHFIKKYFKIWRSNHLIDKIQRINERKSLVFRDKLLKQKVVYILYSYAQPRIISKKHYNKNLKQRAFYAFK